MHSRCGCDHRVFGKRLRTPVHQSRVFLKARGVHRQDRRSALQLLGPGLDFIRLHRILRPRELHTFLNFPKRYGGGEENLVHVEAFQPRAFGHPRVALACAFRRRHSCQSDNGSIEHRRLATSPYHAWGGEVRIADLGREGLPSRSRALHPSASSIHQRRPPRRCPHRAE